MTGGKYSRLPLLMAAFSILSMLCVLALFSSRHDEIVPKRAYDSTVAGGMSYSPGGVTGTISISYTEYISVAGEMAPLSYRDVVVDEIDRYISFSEVISVTNGRTKRVIEAVDGNRWISQSVDSNEEMSYQIGRLEEHPVPGFLSEQFNRGVVRDDFSVIRTPGAPIVPLTTISNAISSGVASMVGQQWLQALKSTQIVVTDGIRVSHVWFDDVYGLRLRHDIYSDGELMSSLIAENVILGDLSGIDYSPSIEPGTRVDYFEVVEFDPGTSGYPDTAGVTSLLYPDDPISGSLYLDVSTYITGTRALEQESVDLGLSEAGWVIGQQLSSQDGMELFSLQGDNRNNLPFSVDPLWPPDWIGNPVDWGTGTFDERFTMQFTDTTSVDIYKINDGSGVESGEQALDFDYLVTWIEGSYNRVVLCLTGVEGEDLAFEWAEAYRNGSS